MIKNIKSLLVVFLLTIMVVSCASTGETKKKATKANFGEKVKVLIVEGSKNIRFEEVKGFGDVTVVYKSKTVALVNGVDKKIPLTIYPKDKFIYVNNTPYRGSMQIRSTNKAGSYIVINEIYLENYLAALINSEMNSSWHIEAVKSQAVIARTYALYQKEKRKSDEYHLKSSDLDQVYKGASKEDAMSFKAVMDTKGQVITYGGKFALTLYHGNGGGRTENIENVWGGHNDAKDFPYLRSRKSPWDKTGPNYSWQFSIPIKNFKAKLNQKGYGIKKIKSIKIKEKTSSGRVLKVYIKAKGKKKVITLSGEELRAMLGYSKLRSTMFKAKKSGNEVLFKGYGSGHGVGLSQWGAKGMAEKGYSYKKILKYYYSGTKLVKKY